MKFDIRDLNPGNRSVKQEDVEGEQGSKTGRSSDEKSLPL
jgi:hypothetical protein